MSNKYDTVDKIVSHVMLGFSPDDFAHFQGITLEEAGRMHHGFGTHIRNTYGLWKDNPLTEKWRTDESSHDIRDGCDYSLDHPDQMSNTIIEAIWHKINK